MQALAQQQIVAAPVKVKSSQQQVIDQLHQHCQQNDSLIMLHGSSGSGKTTIVELFLEQASNYAECAFVTLNERSTADRLRAQILNQLFGTISLNDETLSRQMQRQAPLNHAVIVIDNGETLTEAFLAECVAAVAQLSAIGQKVSIVIAADSRWAYQQKPAPHLRLQGPTMVEVQPLNRDEQVRFVQALLPERQQRLWNADRIQQFLSTINGFPGEIQQRLQLALATQAQRYKDETPAPAASPEEQPEQVSLSDTAPRSGSAIKLTTVIIITLCISLVIAGYLNREVLLSWYDQAKSKTPVSTETTSTAAMAQPSTEQQDNRTDNQTTNNVTALPKFEPLTTASLELMPQDLVVSYREALDDLNRVAAADVDTRELQLQLVKTKSAATPNTQASVNAPAQQEPTQRAYQSDAILQKPAQRIALQIAILSTETLLTEFRNDYGLTESTSVYQREDGRYVIIYGDYASLQQARDATTELPQAIQQMEPWAKSFGAMQAEMDATAQQ